MKTFVLLGLILTSCGTSEHKGKIVVSFECRLNSNDNKNDELCEQIVDAISKKGDR